MDEAGIPCSPKLEQRRVIFHSVNLVRPGGALPCIAQIHPVLPTNHFVNFVISRG
jgi:hypothetical protein